MKRRSSKKPKLIERLAEKSDFDEIIKLSKICFPDTEPWTYEMLESQFKNFPDGMQVIEYEGEIVGSATSLIVSWDEYDDDHTWKEICDNGYITNHDEEGDTLYGIEVMVHPAYQGLKIGRRLYDMRRQLCVDRNLKAILIGGRLPNYHKHSEQFGVRAYVKRVIQFNVLLKIIYQMIKKVKDTQPY
jgi:GNAT superfamily N-acetyltransferase